jgi:hypothetical protein
MYFVDDPRFKERVVIKSATAHGRNIEFVQVGMKPLLRFEVLIDGKCVVCERGEEGKKIANHCYKEFVKDKEFCEVVFA